MNTLFFLFRTVSLLDITSAPIPVILSGAPPLPHTHFLLGLKWLIQINYRVGSLSWKA